MTYPAADMYTTVERSIYHTLVNTITAAGATYPVYNNLLDKKKMADQHSAISILKITDNEDYSHGGGQNSYLDTRSGNDIVRQEWPDTYDLMYQLECMSDNLNDIRAIENIVTQALRPRRRMFLWDNSTTPPAFTTEWIEYRWAGYINRDQPTDNIYNRVRNIHFAARNFKGLSLTTVPAITSIVVTEQNDGTDVDTLNIS